MKKQKQDGFAVVEGILIVIIIALIAGIGWYVMSAKNKSNKSLNEAASNTTTIKVPTTSQTKTEQLSPASSKPTPTVAATKPSASPKITPPQPTAPASTNCSGGSSSGDNNMAVLNANSYSSTKKMHDAIEFAGLTAAANAPKVTVIAPNDYVFSTLTKAQTDFMNASPANMKSVIGWHIVTSCVVWSGQMDSAKANITMNTLNGPVTWTPDYHGKVNGVDMAIYDFFSSNGVIHLITGFIKPPVL